MKTKLILLTAVLLVGQLNPGPFGWKSKREKEAENSKATLRATVETIVTREKEYRLTLSTLDERLDELKLDGLSEEGKALKNQAIVLYRQIRDEQESLQYSLNKFNPGDPLFEILSTEYLLGSAKSIFKLQNNPQRLERLTELTGLMEELH